MKYFSHVNETDKGYTVTVYDHGYILLNEYNPVSKKFETCYFRTLKQAIEAGNNYHNLWND